MTLDRRGFVKTTATAGGGLLVAFHLPGCKASKMVWSGAELAAANKEGHYKTIYLEVSPSNEFFLTFDKAEMGQGVITGQATLFGEEADIHPGMFTMRPAMADSRYGTAGGHMVTGGSTSTPDRWDVLRKAGASYRQALMQTAAKEWQVGAGDVTTDNGVVVNRKTKERKPYADFNKAMVDVELAEEPPLTKPADYKYIGKFTQSVDAQDKSTGIDGYGIDFELDGMKTAIVLRAPIFGSTLKSVNYDVIKKLPGVVDAFAIPTGVAVVCEKYYHTISVRQQIPADAVVWDTAEEHKITSSKLYETYKKDLAQEAPATEPGQTVVTAEYRVPFLNHAPLEPQNTTAWLHDGILEVWSPSQMPTLVQSSGANIADLSRDDVVVHNAKYLGGGFGRRGSLDFAEEAMHVAVKVDYPVKVVWSREDDMQHSPMRPLSVHRLDAVVGDGKIQSWRHQATGQSIIQDLVKMGLPLMLPGWVPGPVGRGLGSAASGLMDVMGAVPMLSEGMQQAYAFEVETDVVEQETAVPSSFWRSVGHSHNGFIVESFFDEVAHALNKDPLDLRLELLKDAKRARTVVEKVAEMADWRNTAVKGNRGLGLAYHFSFNTYCAEIADVEIVGEEILVRKVWAAVDCGQVINPNIVAMQVESGIIYGLSAALLSEIEFEEGRVKQQNFDSYRLLTADRTPEIEVATIDSTISPTGIGEPGLPPIAAAVGNAVFRITGKRLRQMPMRLSSSTT